jgi:hypothetical protein
MSDYYTIKEFAAIIGVSKHTVYGWMNRKPEWVSISIYSPVSGVFLVRKTAVRPDKNRPWHKEREKRIKEEKNS